VRRRRVQGRGAQNGFRRRSRTGSHVHQQLGDQPDQPADQGSVARRQDHVRNETCAGVHHHINRYYFNRANPINDKFDVAFNVTSKS